MSPAIGCFAAARRTAAAVTVAFALSTAAAAQSSPPGPPNALQGFSQNRGQPINIESASLEVRDKEKIATFIDNVRLVQGDTTLECKQLVVYYDEDLAPGGAPRPAKTDKPGEKPGGGQQIRRLEARGGVVVTQKDQTATGDTGIFDMKTNTVTLVGNVVIAHGLNVVRGDRLWVDLNSNVSRVESKAGGGRVNALFQPGAKPGASPGLPTPSAAPAATSGSGAPPPGNARAQTSAADKRKNTGAKPARLN